MEETTMTSQSQLITKTNLKARGWTESLISRFFPTATRECPNPFYRSGPPVKLYDITTVTDIETTQDFQNLKAVADARGKRAKDTAARKNADTLQWANNLPVPQIPQYPRDKLLQLAVSHYNNLWEKREELDKVATLNASHDFLYRISVNFLRHELSPYEERLIETRGRIGAAPARVIIRQRILDTIAKTYPWLSDESKRQSTVWTPNNGSPGRSR